MKWLKRIALTLGAIYLLVLGLLFFQQEALIFHPFARAADYHYGNYPERWFTLPDGVRLNALHLEQGGKGVILYLHGNRGDNGRSLYQTRALRELGYDLLLVDYRGFGKSGGQVANEDHLTDDLQVVYDQLAREYGEENIVLLGFSLGTGPASYLAANNQPKATVLVAPYTSLTAMKDQFFPFVPDFLLRYPLNNLANLQRASGPVRILHGTDDELIPFAMGQRLRAVSPDRIQLIPMPGVGHRGAILSAKVSQVVRELLHH